MNLQLADKVALVTAASKGLGKAAAREFAREGARVAMCARSELIDSAANEIAKETGADVLPLRADVTRQEDIESLVQATLARFGRIDILTVNAGGPKPGTFLDLNPADWEAAVQLTLMSAVRLCYAVVPHMLKQGSGSIVASQSFTVTLPGDNLILSNSIRMAVVGLVKTLANELGPRGIRVNTISPGWTLTERIDEIMKARAKSKGTTPDDETKKVTAEIPLHRMAAVEEYGRAIVWLASPAASYIHGQVLTVDGGITKSPL